MTRFNVGDRVWVVDSGNAQRLVTCPDCLGQCVLTVTLGDGSQVSIQCTCCEHGWQGSRGQVTVYDWHCEVVSDVVKGMEIEGESVRYKLTRHYFPDAVFATKEEAEVEMVKVLAAHQTDEEHRFNQVKDQKGRHHSWAWNATYHRSCARRARKELEYHESKLAVAKAKSKEPEETLT
jgi:hypothetical protein